MATPLFTGSIDFKLAIIAFNVRVLRKARITYAYTPAWPHYHAPSGKERTGDLYLDVGLSILALPPSDSSRSSPDAANRRRWVPLGQLLTAGILSARIHEHIRCRVDAEAREADCNNRARAGWPVPPLPEQI